MVGTKSTCETSAEVFAGVGKRTGLEKTSGTLIPSSYCTKFF
jgi:hypothetical protein